MCTLSAALLLVLVHLQLSVPSTQPAPPRITELTAAEPGAEYRDVNDEGHIAGSIVDPATKQSRAVLWRGEEVVDLSKDAPPGESFEAALGLNNQDQIVGSRPYDPALHRSRGFAWSSGKVTLFDDGPAVRIDEDGRVYVNVLGYSDGTHLVRSIAYAYADGVKTQFLPAVEGPNPKSIIHVVSPHGRLVLGRADSRPEPPPSATRLGYPTLWLDGQAMGVAASVPVGGMCAATDAARVIFPFRGGDPKKGYAGLPATWDVLERRTSFLRTLAPQESAHPSAVNSKSWMVGRAHTGDFVDRDTGAIVKASGAPTGAYEWLWHAVLWLPDGSIVDLNTLLPPDSGWQWLESATDISDSGYVIGYGYMGGQKRYFRLKLQPQAEPR